MEQKTNFNFEAMGINAPFSSDAEQAVIGAIITDSSTLYEVMGILSAENFYHQYNKQIFKEIVLMFTAGKPIDFVTVFDAVSTAGVFENDGDAKNYLYGITQSVPTVSNVGTYARIVYDKYLLRSLIIASKEISEQAADQNETATRLLDFAEQKIYDIRNGKSSSELTHIEAVIMETLEHLSKISGPDKNKFLGLKTGFTHLDSTLTGLNKSDLIILAARPGVGKTSFALNVLTNVAKQNEQASVAIFSLEMTKMQLVERILSAESGVNSYLFRTGEFKDDDFTNIARTSEKISKSRIFIDDTSGISVTEIKAKCRRVDNLGLIIVDYLQLMGGGGKRNESRNQEISDITRAFKIMAKELDVPIILLSQLSRAGDKQQTPRKPMLSDLRDSGSIEQDADIVLFLHRDRVEEGEMEQSYLEDINLIVAKNRHGEVRNINLKWDGKHTKFSSVEYMQDA